MMTNSALREAETHLSIFKIQTGLKIKVTYVLTHSLGPERQADTYNMSLVTACNGLPPHSLSLQTQRDSQTVCLPSIPPCIPPFTPPPSPPSLRWSLSKLNFLPLLLDLGQRAFEKTFLHFSLLQMSPQTQFNYDRHFRQVK